MKRRWLGKYQYDEEDNNALTTVKSSASSSPGIIAGLLKRRTFLFIGFAAGVLFGLILLGIVVAFRKMRRMRRGAMSSKEEGSLDKPKKGSKEANAADAE